MCDFHYNHMYVKYPRANQLRLLFTDMDSLAYAVQTDIYRDLVYDDASRYDFSEYPLDNYIYDTSNRKSAWIQCLCKNVLQHTRPIEKKTAKGVKRKVKDDQINFAHYFDVLHSFKSYVCKQNISSTNHTVRTVHTRKGGLTVFDAKRWLCEDTVHTHPRGDKDTASDPSDLFSKPNIVSNFGHLRPQWSPWNSITGWGSSLICLNQSASAFSLKPPRWIVTKSSLWFIYTLWYRLCQDLRA